MEAGPRYLWTLQVDPESGLLSYTLSFTAPFKDVLPQIRYLRQHFALQWEKKDVQSNRLWLRQTPHARFVEARFGAKLPVYLVALKTKAEAIEKQEAEFSSLLQTDTALFQKWTSYLPFSFSPKKITKTIYEYCYESVLPLRIGPDRWGRLLAHQKVTLEFVLNRNGRAMLADDMGLGKTIQALTAALLYRENWPLLIVCQASSQDNWKREALQWLPIKAKDIWVLGHTAEVQQRLGSLKRQYVAEAKKNKRRKLDAKVSSTDIEPRKVIICSYDKARRLTTEFLALKVGVLICDECQNIKNVEAERTLCILSLAEKVSKVLLLSGTPANQPRHLHSQFTALQPDLIPSMYPKHYEKQTRTLFEHDKIVAYFANHELTWAGRYCAPTPEIYRARGGHKRVRLRVSGSALPEELGAIGAKIFWVRRVKSDHISLPGKHRYLLRFDPNLKQDEKLGTLLKTHDKRLSLLRTTKENSEVYKKEYMAAFNELPSIKLPYVLHYLRTRIFESDLFRSRKIILFAHHRAMLAALFAMVKSQLGTHFSCIKIEGETDTKLRDKQCQQFQTDEKCRIAVMSIRAGGVGLNLTAASIVIFCEILFGPEDALQGEDRAYRLGQTREIDCLYLIADNTMDNKLLKSVLDKQKVSTHIFEGHASTIAFAPLAPHHPLAPLKD